MRTAILLFVVSAFSFAQWTNQQSGTRERLRGISAVSSNVAWASGTHGTYLRTTDGGTTWIVGHVPGADSLDFRDVEAFGPAKAFLLSIGPGNASRIYKTVDAGKTWIQEYEGD